MEVILATVVWNCLYCVLVNRVVDAAVADLENRVASRAVWMKEARIERASGRRMSLYVRGGECPVEDASMFDS